MVKLKGQPQVGMASGRRAGRQPGKAACQRGQASSCRPPQVTDVWWIFNCASSPLSPHLSLPSTRLPRSILCEREPSLDLLITPGCPGRLHLMTSGSHYWKVIVFVITSHFLPPYGNPPVATSRVRFVMLPREKQKRTCCVIKKDVWF